MKSSRNVLSRTGLLGLLTLQAALLFFAMAVVASAAGSEGSLDQKPGLEACISETGSAGSCADGVGLNYASSVTLSPDGKSAYVTSLSSDAVAVFDRNTSTGALTQKPGTDACVSETGAGGCTDGVGLDGAYWVTVSPDGKSAYVASVESEAVAIFDRNTSTGALTQKSGTEACFSETGTGGDCTDGRGLNNPTSVTVSPDGDSAYVASQDSGAVAVFDRSTTTGALTQKSGAEACISDGGTSGYPDYAPSTCAEGVGLRGAISVTVSPDGKSAYVSSASSNAIAVFDRDTTTGALTQKSGPEACISETGAGGCADGVGLTFARALTLSPDGKSAYVVSHVRDAVAIFDRNTSTGTLTQKSGTAGCISEDGTGGDCADGGGLDDPTSVTVSPDGKNAYVTSDVSDAVAIFDRNTSTGALTQKPGTDACVSETGAGGCTDGVGLDNAWSVTVSADGRSAYVASSQSDAVAVFDREDSIPPDKPTFDSTIPASPANSNTPSIKGTAETGSTVKLYTTSDCTGAEAATGPAASFAAPGLGVSVPDETTSTFYATATDGSGNTSACSTDSIAFRNDKAPPETTIDSGPTGTTGATPTFEFSSSEPGSSFECRVDSDAFSSCSSPETVAALTDGPHTFEVKATDAAGNTDPTPATQTFTVDATPPDTTIDSGPTGTITTDQATFTFSGNPAGDTNKIQCRIDSEPFADCTSPKTFTGLSDGPHTAEFRAEDAAGNQDPTPATRSFTVDTTAPETTIDSGPSGPTGDATPSFEFSSEPGATFECRVDSDAFSSCSSPETVAALTDGPHIFEARATDQVGNTDPTPATRTFTVDTTPPDTTIDSGPTGTITANQASFTFSGTPASDTAKIQCRIDSEPFADCSSPKSFTGLSEGPHTAEFRAEDSAGNQDASPTTRSFTVDTTVYRAKISKVSVKGPNKAKKGKRAIYKVKIKNSGNIDATGVKVKVKGKGVKAKKSVGEIAAGKAKTVKVKLKPKKPGKVKTTFKVTSSNAGGKTVKKKIKVKK